MRRIRRRYGHAAKGPMAAFHAAARKIEREIEVLRTGGADLNTAWSNETTAVSKAIGKLYDRSSKPEIRGDDALRTEAWAIIDRLRAEKEAAEAVGFQARQDRRHGIISANKQAEYDRIANMSPHERATYNYQQELIKSRIPR